MKKTKKRLLAVSGIVVTVMALLFCLCSVYVSDYYRADDAAISAFSYSEDITIKKITDRATAYIPDEAKAGFIFYPGGKVECKAYDPLMKTLSEEGILCVLIEMPYNLAVLDMNAADGIRGHFPALTQWYIGGHSLGGSMAASYLKNNADHYEGLVLLAAYSSTDISDKDLRILSIYGENDDVMNAQKYDKYKSNLPSDLTEHIIEGGCHAYFGMYGHQKGDGEPTIENEYQIIQSAKKISELILGYSE